MSDVENRNQLIQLLRFHRFVNEIILKQYATNE